MKNAKKIVGWSKQMYRQKNVDEFDHFNFENVMMTSILVSHIKNLPSIIPCIV